MTGQIGEMRRNEGMLILISIQSIVKNHLHCSGGVALAKVVVFSK